MEESKISWTDGTWNPWVGCDKISKECKYCYIDRILEKQHRKPWGEIYKTKTWGFPQKMQRKAVAEGKRIKLFTCSLSDFFHTKADEMRPAAWDEIRKCPNVDFLVLTKRADRIAAHLPPDWGKGWPNVWLGVSVGVMETAWRIDELRKIPAVIHFISAEPLLESLVNPPSGKAIDLTNIQWLIAGGESGPIHRSMDTIWAEELRLKCEAEGVTFFFKQSSGFKSGEQPFLLGQLHGTDEIYHNWPTLPIFQ